MILSIKKLVKQIKVRLALVEINTKMIKILILGKPVLTMLMLINYRHKFHLVDLLVVSKINKLLMVSKINKLLKVWENSICKKKDNKKKSHLLSHGQVKVVIQVGKLKIENKDGKNKITRLINNIKENLNIKTNGRTQTNRKIQNIKENLKIKNLLKISIKEILNMRLKKIKAQNILERLNTNKSKMINTRGNHNTRNKKTSIRENLSNKNRIINTKGNLNNNNNNSNKMITIIKNHNRDQWLVQAPLLLSNTLEIHQVENHKLHSDILLREIYIIDK